MRLLLLGPPGAGKGTQAIHLAERLGIPHLSTGEILRVVASKGTTIGKEVAGIMQRGTLVPDDLMVTIVRDRIAQSDARSGFILDGFPRTIAQGIALDRILDSAGLRLDRVLELKVDAAMLLDRILKRAADAKASGLMERADDNEEALRVRLDLYRKQTEPLSDYYRSKGILRSVDGLQTIEAVSNVLWEAIGA
jgi:adenylate kinase